MPTPFVNSQDLTDLLGRDVTADAGATLALEGACDVCRDLAERSFTAGTATIALDGSGTDALILPERPVTGVGGTILVNGGTVTEFSFTPGGMLFRGIAGGGVRPVWPRGRQNVVVTYEYGFAPVDMPQSVRAVALALAVRMIVQGPAKSENVGDMSVTYAVAASDLTANELRILQRYRGARSF